MSEVSEGGYASAASGDLRSGAPHTILSYYPRTQCGTMPPSTILPTAETDRTETCVCKDNFGFIQKRCGCAILNMETIVWHIS